jgi:hypothetical protein
MTIKFKYTPARYAQLKRVLEDAKDMSLRGNCSPGGTAVLKFDITLSKRQLKAYLKKFDVIVLSVSYYD